jgi:hypothetical protein
VINKKKLILATFEEDFPAKFYRDFCLLILTRCLADHLAPDMTRRSLQVRTEAFTCNFQQVGKGGGDVCKFVLTVSEKLRQEVNILNIHCFYVQQTEKGIFF